MFGLGDKAFYPAHGVGVIEKIEHANANQDSFYVVRILDSGLKVTVSKARAAELGLRHLVSHDMIDDVFGVLRKKRSDKACRLSQPWNRRQRDYLAKIKSGSIFDHAEILRELHLLQNQKQLSFGEKKLMEQVKKLLIKELACCQDCSEDTMITKINSLLAS